MIKLISGSVLALGLLFSQNVQAQGSDDIRAEQQALKIRGSIQAQLME